MARWKARGRLYIRRNWTFLLSPTVETLWAEIGRSQRFSNGGGSLWAQISFRCPPTTAGIRVIALSCGIKIFAVRRLVLSQYTRVTNGRTDRITTPKIALAYARAVKSSLVYTAPNQELKPMSRVEQRPVICSSPPVQIALVVLLILMLTMFWLKKIMVITQRVVRGTHYTTMINQHQLFASQPHKIQGGYV